MGFQRQYMESAGDPFRLRAPRFIRRMQPGRLLGHAALGLAGNVPVLGSAVNFARSYGLVAGDPGPRRKGAAAGPKHKAKQKAQHRANKHAQAQQQHGGGHGKKKKKGKRGGGGGGGPQIDWNALGEAAAGAVPVVGGLAQEIYRQTSQNMGGAAEEAGATPIAAHPDFGTFGAPAHAARGAHGFGGHRRHTNPANVHALRRAIRRMESFEKLVHKVTPHLAALHPSRSHGGGGGRRRARGHKAGCRCAVCSRA